MPSDPAGPDFSNPLVLWTAAYAAGREGDVLAELESVAATGGPDDAADALKLLPPDC